MSASLEPKWVDDGGCFACGEENEFGLKMRFEHEAGQVVSHVRLPAWLQGWRGVAHGGAIAMLLDEAMAHAVGDAGAVGVTAELNVRFRKTVPLGAALIVRARAGVLRRKLVAAEAEIVDAAGAVLASASARFVAVGQLPPGMSLARAARGA